jgi:hypothetical protein
MPPFFLGLTPWAASCRSFRRCCAAAPQGVFGNGAAFENSGFLVSPFCAAAQYSTAAVGCLESSSSVISPMAAAGAMNSNSMPAQQQQSLLPMHSTPKVAEAWNDPLLMLPSIDDDDVYLETDQLLERLLVLPSLHYPKQQDMLQMSLCGSEPDASLLDLLLPPYAALGTAAVKNDIEHTNSVLWCRLIGVLARSG